MLRTELIASVDRLLHALKLSRAEEAIRKNQPALSIAAYHAFAREYVNSTDADQHLLRIFELEMLLRPNWWGSALADDNREQKSDAATRPVVHSRVQFALEKLPQIIDLLRHRSDGEFDPTSQITLVIPENEDQKSPPARVIRAIESVVLIYSAICKMHNEEENTLALRSCDSGSDKSFDFTGLPQVIEQVKNVIFGIIDRVIFFREMKYSERVKCVAESLPVLDQIAQMSAAKKLSPEQAELLRRDLINGATKFLETGSLIPEIKDQSRYEPSALLQTSPTLLIEGPPKKALPEVTPLQGVEMPKKPRKSRSSASEKKTFSISDIEDFISSSSSLSDTERQQLLDVLSGKKS